MTTKQKTIGLDLGDRQHAACVLSANGKVLVEETVVNTRECLEAFSGRHPGAVIAMETGTHSPWISRLFQAAGHRVVVANARQLRLIAQNTRKSDEADARLLARLCRADETLLCPVQHRSEACQRALVRLKTRDALVRSRVDLSNSARFLVKSLGLRLPTGVKATVFTRKARELLDAPTCALIEPLLRAIDALNAQIATLERAIEQLAEQQYPDAALLQQIPGVGPLTALCYVLTLETPERFPCAREVGAYLGLVPRRDQSGQSDKQLGITKAGNTQLRCLLVNCAHYILGRYGPECDLRAAGLRLAARGGKAAKKRAVIAVARKLAVVLMTLWRTRAVYQPVRPPPAAAAA